MTITSVWDPAAPTNLNLKVASVATAYTIDPKANKGKHFKVTLTANTVFTMGLAATTAARITVVVVKGAFTPSWAAGVSWVSALAPTYDAIHPIQLLTVDGGVSWIGSWR